MNRTHRATESLDVDSALARLPQRIEWMPVLLERIRRRTNLPSAARVLDLGAAQGLNLIAVTKAGHEAYGVEPSTQAIEVGGELARHVGVTTTIVEGVAEAIPFPAESFDLVLAQAVLEHVTNPRTVLQEAHRVLRAGGAFYFYTTNVLCPRQSEIRGFPLFPWYPRRAKHAIMRWASARRPELIGHTQTPAYHWFTPWWVRRAAAEAGFRRTYDHWDLKLDDRHYLTDHQRMIVRAVHSTRLTRAIGDVFVPSLAFLLVK